jgi:hypothetical protein
MREAVLLQHHRSTMEAGRNHIGMLESQLAQQHAAALLTVSQVSEAAEAHRLHAEFATLQLTTFLGHIERAKVGDDSPALLRRAQSLLSSVPDGQVSYEATELRQRSVVLMQLTGTPDAAAELAVVEQVDEERASVFLCTAAGRIVIQRAAYSLRRLVVGNPKKGNRQRSVPGANDVADVQHAAVARRSLALEMAPGAAVASVPASQASVSDVPAAGFPRDPALRC